jgi:hypothetical protein
MANIPISALPASAGLDPTDLFAVVDGGVTRRATLAQVMAGAPATALVPGSMSAADFTRLAALKLAWDFIASGDLVGFAVQPGTYDTLAQNDALLVTGDGIFDAPRRAHGAIPAPVLRITLRAPSSVPDPTTVEFYRIRGAYPGTVTSLGTVTLAGTDVFATASAAAGADVVVGDILFVAFSAVPSDAQAADLTATISE